MLSSLQISKPSIYLCGFFLIAQFIAGFNDVRNTTSNISDFWYVLAFFWALNWWFLVDSRKHADGWSNDLLDMGMFLYVAGFFLVPYYLFKTRGWKALYTIGLFLVIIFGAYLAGGMFQLIMQIF